MAKKIKRIQHNYKCDVCGSPATINQQQQWHLYEITPNDDFKEQNCWEGGDNKFYCDKCYEATQ